VKGSVAALLAVSALGGCGGSGAAAENDSVETVRSAVVGFGTTQAVRCEDAGELELRAREVVRCGFEEEEDVSGVMKARDRCYVVESGAVRDVTSELPVGTSCTVSSP